MFAHYAIDGQMWFRTATRFIPAGITIEEWETAVKALSEQYFVYKFTKDGITRWNI